MVNSVLDRTSSLSDSLTKLQQLPSRYFNKVNQKAAKLDQHLTRTTGKALQKMQAQELAINAKLSKIDSAAAHNLLSTSLDSLSHLQGLIKGKVAKITGRIPGGEYIPYLDSLQNSLNFLSKYSNQLSQINNLQQKLRGSMGEVQQLEGKLQQVEDIQNYIQDQQQVLTEALSKYGDLFQNNLGQIGKDVYYYRAEVENYKQMWQNPDQVEAKALELLNKVPAFTRFMQQHSILASLFRIPANYGQSVAGLQTRAMVEGMIQQRMAGASPQARQAINQEMQQAKQELNQLKDKFPNLNSTAQMPNFQPKELKSKTLLQRLEYGANMQFEKASGIFPTTSDIATQVAYKFSEKGSAGVGASFKLGWGQTIQKLHFSAQGLGLRSFLDYQLKGTFFINGGFEFDYYSTIPNIPALKDLNGWSKSALLGIERKYKISNKVNGDVMLLYDFLHNEHIPRTSPVVFRFGYTF